MNDVESKCVCFPYICMHETERKRGTDADGGSLWGKGDHSQYVRVVRSGLGQLLLLIPSFRQLECFGGGSLLFLLHRIPPLSVRPSVPAVYNVTTTNEDRRRVRLRAPARLLGWALMLLWLSSRCTVCGECARMKGRGGKRVPCRAAAPRPLIQTSSKAIILPSKNSWPTLLPPSLPPSRSPSDLSTRPVP